LAQEQTERELNLLKDQVSSVDDLLFYLVLDNQPTTPSLLHTLHNNNNERKNMSWLIYKAKVVGTYTFIYAQKVWGLLPF